MKRGRVSEAVAHPNLALVKYWGKRDEVNILPHQSSLSLTLAPMEVRAQVSFGTEADEVVINGRKAEGEQKRRVVRLLDELRAEAKKAGDPPLGGARVETSGNFPISAGLASSAAAFASLAVAANAAAGRPPDGPALSRLARLGSGSACRSIYGGFAAWRRGKREDGEDSFAEPLFSEQHWPDVRMVVCIVSAEEKEMSSRDGMGHTVKTSPYYPAWAEDAEREVGRATEIIRRKDLEALGQLAERNAWRMHATAFAADPPLCYMKPKTLELILALADERKRGQPFWFTLDAGPNPAILTDAAHQERALQLAKSFGEALVCAPGGGARLLSRSAG